MPWGVEYLPKRTVREGREGGVDQFGGTEDASVLVEAVRAGEIPEARIDQSADQSRAEVRARPVRASVRRSGAARRTSATRRSGPRASTRSAGRSCCWRTRTASFRWRRRGKARLSPRRRLRRCGALGFIVVPDPSQADVAIVRPTAPFQTLHPGYVFGAMQHEGDLGFQDGDKEYDELMRMSARCRPSSPSTSIGRRS